MKSSYPAQGPSSGGSGYYGGNYNGGYNGSYNGGYSSLDKKSTVPEKTATAPAQLPAKTEPEDKAVSEKKTNDGESDGWEKRGSTSRFYDDDDDDFWGYGYDDRYGNFHGGYFDTTRYSSDPFYARGY